jgi:hypothetical protein
MLAFFAGVKTLYRPVVAHYAGIYKAFASVLLELFQNGFFMG